MEREKLVLLAGKATSESKNIDFKKEIDLSSTLSWCEIIKDIVAMANSGGGILLFGVNDDGSFSNFDESTLLRIDPATVTDKLNSYLGEDFTQFEIIRVKRGRKELAAILIEGSNVPLVFTRNGADKIDGGKQKPVFIKGTVYFRRGAKSEPGNTQHLRRLIERELERVRKEWFKGIREVTEAGINDAVRVDIRRRSSSPATISGLINLSEKGQPVKFTNEHVIQLKELFPLSYQNVLIGCKKKRKTKQSELNAYLKKCKENKELSFNWKTISKSIEIPTSIPDKFTYSPKVIERF